MTATASTAFDGLPDTQSVPDSRQIPIKKVGIKDILYPVRILGRSGTEQHTVARFNMYVNLPHNFKGTYMSPPC
jgi:GTP cyclohydrolase I